VLPAEIPDWKKKGNAFLAEGKLDAAVDCYRQAVQQSPDDAYAHLNLGFGLVEQERFEEAADSLRESIAVDSGIFDSHYLLGKSLVSRGLFGEAIASFGKAISLNTGFEIAHWDMGRALERLGQGDAALDAYRQAVVHKPDFAEALVDVSRLSIEREEYAQGLAWADRLKTVDPSSDVGDMLRAQALGGLEQYEEALQATDAAMRRGRNDAATWLARGDILFALQRYDDALVAYESALERDPDLAEAITNCGITLLKLERGESAIAFFHRASSLKADDPRALYNLAFSLMSNGEYRASLDIAERALSLHPEDPDLHWNKATCHLLLGELESGWIEHEWRWKATVLGSKPVKPDFPLPMWTGQQQLQGKSILIAHEQGLGDSIQFVRYTSLLRREGAANVYVQVPLALQPLFDGIEGCQLLVEGDLLPHIDFYCPMLSLPFAFGTTLATIPASVPYLDSDIEKQNAWLARLGARRGLRVGLVWSGNVKHSNDRNRSISLKAILDHAPANCQFVSLQKEVREQDQRTLDEHSNVLNFASELLSFADTAALVACMDVIVSVDTSVAHLAGAMACPVWILLPHQPDWRWMLDRGDSPWYPTARLFRQPTVGDWASVVQRVMAELKSLPVNPA
jgi:tetratricopeptide (TPR) repeat protein